MFRSSTPEGAQRKREMLDALCALDDEAATAAEEVAEVRVPACQPLPGPACCQGAWSINPVGQQL